MWVIHRAGRLRRLYGMLCLCFLALCVWAFQLARRDSAVPIGFLKDQAGRVAYFEANSTDPLYCYNQLTRLLPSEACEAILQGVPVYSTSQLSQLEKELGGEVSQDN